LELRNDGFRHVNWNSEANSLAVRNNGRVYADDFPSQVEQWPAAVAGVDGCIGLDEIVVGAGTDDSSFAAYDPLRHGFFQSEWAPDRYDPAADLEVIRIAQN